MNYPKVKKISKISYIVFNFLVCLTLFLPTISLDRYVEYDFSNGYYNENYVGYTEPVATKITPLMMINNLFAERMDMVNAKTEYIQLDKELNEAFLSGKITEEEYQNTLANSRVYSKYIALSLYFGGEPELARLQSKMFLYSIVILIFYIIALLFLVLNIINFFHEKKLINVANIFGGWIQVALLLLFNMYTFSLALSTKNNITGFDGSIIEETTICMGPKFIPLFLLALFIIYALWGMYLERTDAKIEKQNKEIPTVITQSITTQKRYRKINSKKSKYKNGSKKKRHR